MSLVMQAGFPLQGGTVYGAEEDLEYKVKAAFMLNFAKFILWPKNGSSEQVFRICVLGEDPFGSALSGIENKTIAGKPIELIRTFDVLTTGQCQLVYISRSERGNLAEIIKTYNRAPILLVSDIETFAGNGGTIELVTQNNRLRFIINLSQAKKVGLKINASLLKLASEVL